MTLYDAIIIGGGPAGLSVAAALSKKHHVLVVEKQQIGMTTKSWFVPPFVIDTEIKKYTYGGVARFLTNTFTGAKISWKAKLFKEYPYIKEKELLVHWGLVIKQNGSTILEQCSYQNHSTKKDDVTVKTTKGIFKGKLLIDASGHDSPVLKKYKKTPKHYYWWSVYGCIAEHPNGLHGMKVGDFMLWQTFKDSTTHLDSSLGQGRPVFEYEILDGKTSFPLILYLRKKKVPFDEMRKEFLHIMHKEESTKSFHDAEMKELKYGWYPSGGLTQQYAENRVAFIGDAGSWATPCGWGMGFILNNYKTYAKQLSALLKRDTLDKKSIEESIKLNVKAKHEILFDVLMTHFLVHASASQLDKFINFFSSMDPILCEKLFTLTISQKDIKKIIKAFLKEFDFRELLHIIPPEDYLVILKEAKYFVEDAVLESIEEAIKIFKKKSAKKQFKENFGFYSS